VFGIQYAKLQGKTITFEIEYCLLPFFFEIGGDDHVDLFEELDTCGHEQVIFCHNKDVGLKAIIAIHDTTLGPALGGLRMWDYASEQEALNDVLRLSRGMTYKAAVSGLNLGGGKSVIIGDPKTMKSEGLFRAFGRFVDSLNGRYITAEDVSIDVNDMEYVFQETEYAVGVHPVHGGSGDPSPYTAFGTLQGIQVSLKKKFDNEEIGNYSYAVQGLGHVGYELCKLLRKENAKVFVTDINPDAIRRCVDELGCEAVGLDEIYSVDADVYVPCALGGTVNPETIEQFKFKIVCGSANNQLAETSDGDELEKRGILYAPDYAVNAGGLMNVAIELEGYNRERAMRMIRAIYYNVGQIYKIADQENIATWMAADKMAEQRMKTLSHVKRPHMGNGNPRFQGRK